MRPVYLRVEKNNITRKVMMDMAYLVSHRKIRLPKWLYEDGLFFYYKKDDTIEKYYLSKDKVKTEDENHYFFEVPFKDEQLEGIEN